MQPHDPLTRVEMPIVRVIATMEHIGMAVSATKLAALQLPLIDRMARLEKRAHTLAQMSFILSAPGEVSG